VKGVGSVLVDGAGRVLYLFEKDSGTKTACAVDPCKAAWPAFAGSGTASAGDGVDAAKIGSADAQLPGQVTYNGHLLYYFAGDKAPGEANGVGIPAWYLLDANGDKIVG
jgi:predicted lipoprotein with Yx(FWY)xxD motif